jgi:hypothetical protein
VLEAHKIILNEDIEQEEKMNNLFVILDRNTGQVIERKSYTTTGREDKYKLKEQMNGIILRCCCKNHVEIKISSDLRFYKSKKSDKHDEDCTRFRNDYRFNSEYDKGWKTDEEGNHSVRVGSLIPKEKKEPQEVENQEPKGSIHSGTSVTNYKVEALGLIRKINMMTWETLACNYGKNPENLSKFNQTIYYTLKKITLLGTKKKLSDIEYKREKIASMKAGKDVAFIYMYVDGLEDKGTYHLLRVKDHFSSIHRFYVNKEEYEEEWNREIGHSDILVVGGFAYKKGKESKILTLGQYALMAVSEQGLFVESSFEKVAYEAFHQDNRVFYKPYRELEEYGGKIPDIILVNRKKTMIGEIFGMNTPEYLENRENKLRLAEEISDIYDFWKWDVYKGENLILPDK